MYVIKKTESFHDVIQVINSKGESLNIEFNFDITPTNVKNFREIEIQYIESQKITDDNIEKISKLGECIYNLFRLIFGEENANNLVNFYSNDYSKMLIDIFPYIQNVIVPELNKSKKRLKSKYKKRF